MVTLFVSCKQFGKEKNLGNLTDLLDLLIPHIFIVDDEHFHLLRVLWLILVHSDDRLCNHN